MKCYRDGGCGPYEYLSCSECPASKQSYQEHNMSDNELVTKLREYGRTDRVGKMGEECRVPKNILNMAAERIEVLKSGR